MSYLVAKSTDTGIFSSDESAFHGLKVDRNTGTTNEGSLTYTKTYINDPSASVSLADFGIPYNGIDDVNAGTANATHRSDNTTQLADGRTPGTRAYDGARFDNVKLTYYVNSDGFLGARYFSDFTYNVGSDGNTRNYTT